MTEFDGLSDESMRAYGECQDLVLAYRDALANLARLHARNVPEPFQEEALHVIGLLASEISPAMNVAMQAGVPYDEVEGLLGLLKRE